MDDTKDSCDVCGGGHLFSEYDECVNSLRGRLAQAKDALREIARGKAHEDMGSYALTAARLTGIARRALDA